MPTKTEVTVAQLFAAYVAQYCDQLPGTAQQQAYYAGFVAALMAVKTVVTERAGDMGTDDADALVAARLSALYSECQPVVAAYIDMLSIPSNGAGA